MNIEIKFKLIEYLKLAPSELSFLESIIIPINVTKDLLDNKTETLSNYLENVQNDATLQDNVRLLAACFRNRLKENSINIKFDNEQLMEEDYDSYDELSDEEREMRKEEDEMWQGREKEYRKALPKIRKYTQDEWNNLMFNYVWEKYPQLHKGFNRQVYCQARDSFFGSIGIAYYRYQLSQKIQDKINIAEEYTKNEIDNRFKILETESIEEWTNQYKEMMNDLGISKYTKGSIKEFFKKLDLKVSTFVIDTIKRKLGST